MQSSAERYLGHLARNLEYEEHESRDLAWWQLAAAVRPRSRILAVVIACSLITSLSIWLVLPVVFALEGADIGPVYAGTLIGVPTAVAGPAVGLAFRTGLRLHDRHARYEARALAPATAVAEPAQTDRRRASAALSRAALRRPVRGGGLTVGLGYGPALTLTGELLFGARPNNTELLKGTFVNILVFGIIFGTAAGPTFGLIALLEAPIDLGSAATPVSLLAANRRTVLRQSMVLMPMLAILIVLLGRLWVVLLAGPVLGPLEWPWSGAVFIGTVGGLTGAGSTPSPSPPGASGCSSPASGCRSPGACPARRSPSWRTPTAAACCARPAPSTSSATPDCRNTSAATRRTRRRASAGGDQTIPSSTGIALFGKHVADHGRRHHLGSLRDKHRGTRAQKRPGQIAHQEIDLVQPRVLSCSGDRLQ